MVHGETTGGYMLVRSATTSATINAWEPVLKF